MYKPSRYDTIYPLRWGTLLSVIPYPASLECLGMQCFYVQSLPCLEAHANCQSMFTGSQIVVPIGMVNVWYSSSLRA